MDHAYDGSHGITNAIAVAITVAAIAAFAAISAVAAIAASIAADAVTLKTSV